MRNLYEETTITPEHPYRTDAPMNELATPKALPRYPPRSGPRTNPADDMEFITPKTVPRTSGVAAWATRTLIATVMATLGMPERNRKTPKLYTDPEKPCSIIKTTRASRLSLSIAM